jgi:hypothetical protein
MRGYKTYLSAWSREFDLAFVDWTSILPWASWLVFLLRWLLGAVWIRCSSAAIVVVIRQVA